MVRFGFRGQLKCYETLFHGYFTPTCNANKVKPYRFLSGKSDTHPYPVIGKYNLDRGLLYLQYPTSHCLELWHSW